MNFKLKVWRQAHANAKGSFMNIDAPDISSDTSFLEMLDIVNERLLEAGDEPIAFGSEVDPGELRLRIVLEPDHLVRLDVPQACPAIEGGDEDERVVDG